MVIRPAGPGLVASPVLFTDGDYVGLVEIVAAEGDSLPPPQHCEPGGSIRWVAGIRNGPRTQSWSVFGSTKDDDVYLGPRSQTGAIKLSVHRSGSWRMAWTEQYARSLGLPEDTDRVLTRWDPPNEVRPGWRHAVTVLLTSASVAPQPPRERGLGKVAFFPPPDPGSGLWFRIMIGQPSTELVVTGALEVGTLRLPSGGMVGVMVRHDPLSPATAAKVADIRSEIVAGVTAAGARGNTAFAWGRMADDAVLLTDPGPVEPEQDQPGESSRGGAPGGSPTSGAAIEHPDRRLAHPGSWLDNALPH